MKTTLKIASVILQYPTNELKAEAGNLQELLALEADFSPEDILKLEPLFARFQANDIYELQELYVLLFDRSRSISLNIFEHVHGESRERGSAMVDLLEDYRAAGLQYHSAELPDYLPAFLEYLTLLEPEKAKAYLREVAHILYALEERLNRRQSDYAPLFASLAKLGGAEPDGKSIDELQSEPDDDPTDLEALDAVWQEAEVTFGPSTDAGCPATRDMLARMAVPKNQPLGGSSPSETKS